MQRAADAAGAVELEVVRHTVDGIAALGRTLVDLTVAQTRQNLETLAALRYAIDWGQVAEAVDWERVMRIQSEHLRASPERVGELTQRYLELTQALFTAHLRQPRTRPSGPPEAPRRFP